jgi:hypothetical protein
MFIHEQKNLENSSTWRNSKLTGSLNKSDGQVGIRGVDYEREHPKASKL